MVEFGGQFGMAAMRLVRPTLEEAHRGLRCLIDGPEKTPAMRRDERVEGQVGIFLAYAETTKIDIRRMVVAMEGERLTAMALWVPSPGRTAAVFPPPLKEHPQILPQARAVMAAVFDDARDAGALMTQVMVEPGDSVTMAACEQLNMMRLATLNYMERQPPAGPPVVHLPPGVRLEAYNPAMHDVLRRAIAASYEGTMDCPALSGMREIDDVIAGHRGVGVFDPNLWSVVLQGDAVLGCLLLAEVPGRRGLEVVYLGLAPAGRGRGIGRALMQRTLAIGSRRGFEVMSLAVDSRNTPALKLYKRFGYSQVAQRVAFVKKLA